MQNTIGNKVGSRKMMMMLLFLSLGKVAKPFVSRMLKQWPRGCWPGGLCCAVHTAEQLEPHSVWTSLVGAVGLPAQLCSLNRLCTPSTRLSQGMCTGDASVLSHVCIFGKGSWKGIQVRPQLQYGGNLVKFVFKEKVKAPASLHSKGWHDLVPVWPGWQLSSVSRSRNIQLLRAL